MKNPDLQLRAELPETRPESLSGLSEKHAKKLQKAIGSSVKKLSKSFSKTLNQERKADEKKHRKATRASVKDLVQELQGLLAKQFVGSAKQRRKRSAAGKA